MGLGRASWWQESVVGELLHFMVDRKHEKRAKDRD
jgi:hypothetical protein